MREQHILETTILSMRPTSGRHWQTNGSIRQHRWSHRRTTTQLTQLWVLRLQDAERPIRRLWLLKRPGLQRNKSTQQSIRPASRQHSLTRGNSRLIRLRPIRSRLTQLWASRQRKAERPIGQLWIIMPQAPLCRLVRLGIRHHRTNARNRQLHLMPPKLHLSRSLPEPDTSACHQGVIIHILCHDHRYHSLSRRIHRVRQLPYIPPDSLCALESFRHLHRLISQVRQLAPLTNTAATCQSAVLYFHFESSNTLSLQNIATNNSNLI